MNSRTNRVKKLEERTSSMDNPVTKIVVEYIDADGKVSSSMTKELVDGVWCEDGKAAKSINQAFLRKKYLQNDLILIVKYGYNDYNLNKKDSK